MKVCVGEVLANLEQDVCAAQARNRVGEVELLEYDAGVVRETGSPLAMRHGLAGAFSSGIWFCSRFWPGGSEMPRVGNGTTYPPDTYSAPN
jgi:hypothetical protein